MDSMRSVLSVVFWITRLCEPANPPSQCQICDRSRLRSKLFDFRRAPIAVPVRLPLPRAPQDAGARRPWHSTRLRELNGGANRDRTDDLKLAKLALSQLSYGPVVC